VITQLAAGKRSIKLGSLHPTRDFSFVHDTAAGFIAAAASDRAFGEIINIGSGFEISIGDTARAIADVMGVELEITTDEQRLRPESSEVERLLAGTEKAARLMNWTPAYGGLEGFKRGLAATVEWFRQPANLAGYKYDRYNI
jgi:dTDP-glucose 4,6-dehydratase